MKIAKLCSASIIMNMSTLSEYVKKRKNVTYVQHLIIMTEHVVFEIYQQDINMSTAIKITQCES